MSAAREWASELSASDLERIQPHLKGGESILWCTRPSMLGLVPIFTYAVLAGLGIIVPILLRLEDAPGVSFVASGSFLFAFGGLAIEFVRRFVTLRYTMFVITKERFYSVTSFFTTTVKSVPLSRVTLVTLHQGFIIGLFGLWSAQIVAYGEAGARLDIPAIRDGERLLAEAGSGLGRGANAAWILRGD